MFPKDICIVTIKLFLELDKSRLSNVLKYYPIVYFKVNAKMICLQVNQ